MAEPTYKVAAITDLLDSLADRTNSITNNVCVPAPFGCGGRATRFTDFKSLQEYRISGLCQTCQDNTFNMED